MVPLYCTNCPVTSHYYCLCQPSGPWGNKRDWGTLLTRASPLQFHILYSADMNSWTETRNNVYCIWGTCVTLTLEIWSWFKVMTAIQGQKLITRKMWYRHFTKSSTMVRSEWIWTNVTNTRWSSHCSYATTTPPCPFMPPDRMIGGILFLSCLFFYLLSTGSNHSSCV